MPLSTIPTPARPIRRRPLPHPVAERRAVRAPSALPGVLQ